MEDLVLCDGGHCPLKERCARYIMSNFNNVYLSYIPYDKDTRSCEFFEEFVDEDNDNE